MEQRTLAFSAEQFRFIKKTLVFSVNLYRVPSFKFIFIVNIMFHFKFKKSWVISLKTVCSTNLQNKFSKRSHFCASVWTLIRAKCPRVWSEKKISCSSSTKRLWMPPHNMPLHSNPIWPFTNATAFPAGRLYRRLSLTSRPIIRKLSWLRTPNEATSATHQKCMPAQCLTNLVQIL